MDLFKKIYPKDLDDIIFYNDQIKLAKKWLSNFKNNIDRTKKSLLIIGDTGSGKTALAHMLLKKFDYQAIELNASNIRSQKKISEFLHKSLGFNNVIDMFYERKRPIGLILDELETLCQNTDKGGLSEFISILKDNQKYEKNLKKYEELENKKSKKVNQKPKIDINKFIFIENPIICTYTDYNDKKINELKKFCQVIYLKNIKIDDYELFLNDIKNKHGILQNKEIESNIIKDLHKQCKNDIRKFIQSIDNINLYKEPNINFENYTMLKKLNDTTKNDIQLIHAVDLFMNEKLTLNKLDLLFYLEPYHLPYTIYQNFINFINNTDMKNKDKFELYSKYLETLSYFDKTNNLLYDSSDWLDIDNYLRLYGVYYPNYYINEYKFNKKMKTEIEFTNIHNKASQMLVNKKLISNAKYSLNKMYSSLNNTILDCEIIFFYFNEFRNCILNEDFKNLHEKNLIKFMNYYKINYDDLENLLKIEKINKDEDKRKKNITVSLKEKIIENLDITLRT